MKRYRWKLSVAAGCLAGLAAGAGASAGAQVVDASVCDVVNHPMKFDGQTVRVKGVVQTDFDIFIMRGDTCSGSLWLSYPAGTKVKSGPAAVLSLQLAANATGTPGKARPAVTLTQNADFATFDNLLTQKVKTPGMCLGCVKNDVAATLVGRVDGTDNAGLTRDADGKITGLDGFGNMNQYSTRLVIESVSDVTAKPIDFSKAAKVDGDNQGESGKDYMALTKKAEEAFKGQPGPIAQIDEVLKAYGAPGQDNGVIVSFGNTANVPDGEGTKSAKSSPDGLLLTATFDPDKLKGDALSRAIAHQGVEINLLRAKEVLSCKEMELRAWTLTITVVIGSRQKTLTVPGGTAIWSDGWPPADKNSMSVTALLNYVDDREQMPR